MNGPNKLEHSIAQDQKGVPITNTKAYWAHSYFMKKMKCCEDSTSFTKISIKNSKGTNDLAYFSAASMTTKKTA